MKSVEKWDGELIKPFICFWWARSFSCTVFKTSFGSGVHPALGWPRCCCLWEYAAISFHKFLHLSDCRFRRDAGVTRRISWVVFQASVRMYIHTYAHTHNLHTHACARSYSSTHMRFLLFFFLLFFFFFLSFFLSFLFFSFSSSSSSSQGFKVLLSFLPLGARKLSYIRTRHSL